MESLLLKGYDEDNGEACDSKGQTLNSSLGMHVRL